MSDIESNAIAVVGDGELTLLDDDKDVGIASANVGAILLSEKERAILEAPIVLDQVAIREDGSVYLPHVFYRARLCAALGIGSFGQKTLRLQTEIVGEDTIIYAFTAFFIRGSLIANAVGSHKYRRATEKRLDFSDAIESATSNAFVRNCKQAGILTEPWVPAFRKAFIHDYCTKVFVNVNGRFVEKWRLKADEPFLCEMAVKPK